MPLRSVLTILMLVVVCAGCTDRNPAAGNAPGAAESTVEPKSIDDVPTYVLADSPVVTIGGSDSRPDYQLVQTVRAIRLPDGQIVIGDVMRMDLRYYDENGAFIRRVGGEGQGPGEFERLSSIARMADSPLIAWDRTLRRVTHFSAGGDVVKVIPFPSLEAFTETSARDSSRFYAIPYDILPLDGERFAAFMLGEPKMELIPPGPFLIQDSLPVYLGGPDGKWSEVGGGPYAGILWYFFNRAGRIFPGFYGERLKYAGSDSVFYLASTRNPLIRKVSATTGEAAPFVMLPGPPRPLTDGDREVIRERMISSHPAEAFDAMEIPSDLPMLLELLVSPDGDLWVQLFQSRTDSETTWVMYDPRGEPFGKLTIPATLRLVDVGDDYVLGITTDALDQETVHLYPISPG